MNVVIMTTTSVASRQPLGGIPAEVDVQVVASGRATLGDVEALVVSSPSGPLARLGDRISQALRTSAPARMILRISPLDPGARFWRSVRRDPRVQRLIAGADLLIAADRDANFACWQLARRTGIPAVSGLPAGEKEVARRVSG